MAQQPQHAATARTGTSTLADHSAPDGPRPRSRGFSPPGEKYGPVSPEPVVESAVCAHGDTSRVLAHRRLPFTATPGALSWNKGISQQTVRL